MVSSITASEPFPTASPGARYGPADTPATPTSTPNSSSGNSRIEPVKSKGSSPNDLDNVPSLTIPQESPVGKNENQDSPHSAKLPDFSAASGGGLGHDSSNSGGNISGGPGIQYEGDSVSPQGTVHYGSQRFRTPPGSGVVIGSATLQPGDQTNHSGTTVSVGANDVAIGNTTYTMPSQNTPTHLFVNSQSIVRGPNDAVKTGTFTYLPGTETYISGMAVSVGSDVVVANSATYSVPLYSYPFPATSVPSNNQPTTTNSDGGPSGTINSIRADDSGLIANGNTASFPGTSTSTPANGAVVTPGDAAIVVSGTKYLIFAFGDNIYFSSQIVPFPATTTVACIGIREFEE